MSIETTTENPKNCPRFEGCSINICPLDPEAEIRSFIPGEESCPFTLKKRLKNQKGIRVLATYDVLKVIPEPNLKMLNKRNLKRWQSLQKHEKRKQ